MSKKTPVTRALKAINTLTSIIGEDEGLNDGERDQLFSYLNKVEMQLVPPCECTLDHFHFGNEHGCIMRGCPCMRPGNF